jgi:16S rRNA (guanine527-N7)-methyltransferase
MKTNRQEALINKAYIRLQKEYNLTDLQLERMKQYLEMLLEVNELHNLTAITDPLNAINFHLFDSLELTKHYPVKDCKGIVDVGSGGGLPGIPLAILYPDLPIYLVEVTKKKIEFLWSVLNKLELKSAFVYELDWRTFIRKTDFDVDLFCARASLQLDELFRMFKPSCLYNNTELVYWASRHWAPTEKEQLMIQQVVNYEVGNKERKLVFFTKK